MLVVLHIIAFLRSHMQKLCKDSHTHISIYSWHSSANLHMQSQAVFVICAAYVPHMYMLYMFITYFNKFVYWYFAHLSKWSVYHIFRYACI